MALYNKKENEYAKAYKRKAQKQIALSYKRDEYDKTIAPAVNLAGIPTATFIKEAVENRIECEEIIRNSGLTVDGSEEMSEFIKTAVEHEIAKKKSNIITYFKK